MSLEVKTAIALITQIFFLTFMACSGICVALDAKKHGRPPGEVIIWGIFAACFIFLGLLVYLFWRKHFFKPEK